MSFPKYDTIADDIQFLIQMANTLNPFAKMEPEHMKKDVKETYDVYHAMISHLQDLANPEYQDKDSAWNSLQTIVDEVKTKFDSLPVEEINKKISNDQGLKLWEFSYLTESIRNRMEFMKLKENILPPKDNEPEYEKLSEKHNTYSNLAKDFDSIFEKYASHQDFVSSLNAVAQEEEKRRLEFEQYNKEPERHYTKIEVDIPVNGSIQKMNYADAYDLYHTEYTKQAAKETSLQEQINECFEKMKSALKKKAQDNLNAIDTLQNTVNESKSKMNQLTKDVLETIEVGDIESKLMGDVHSIEDYFKTLDKEIADRPLIAIRKKTREEKSYQLKRKAYLEGLRQKDKYVADISGLTDELNQLGDKYGKLYGKTLDQMVARGEKAIAEKLESLSDEHIDADKALVEFNNIKERFIKAYSVFSSNKVFQAQVRDCKVPSVFITSMINTVNRYDSDILDPIINNSHSSPAQQKKVKDGCVLLNANYSQMKQTKVIIENCEAQIETLNKNKIDPALYEQKVLDDALIDTYGTLGIDPKKSFGIDLKELIKERNQAIIAKQLAEDNAKKYEPLKKAYLDEEKNIQAFLKVKEEKAAAYNQIKGSTEKMTSANEKVLTAWKEYKELQAQSKDLKDSIFNDPSEKGNAQLYKDMTSNIATGLQRFLDIAKVGRDSIFKDSEEYQKMIQSIRDIVTPSDGTGKPMLKETDPVKIKEKLDVVVGATAKYLKAKSKQWRLFPSTQRITRLSFANHLLVYAGSSAEELMKVQAQMVGIKNETMKEYDRAEKELGKENIHNFEDFFKEIVKPRIKAAPNSVIVQKPEAGVKIEPPTHGEKKEAKPMVMGKC